MLVRHARRVCAEDAPLGQRGRGNVERPQPQSSRRALTGGGRAFQIFDLECTIFTSGENRLSVLARIACPAPLVSVDILRVALPLRGNGPHGHRFPPSILPDQGGPWTPCGREGRKNPFFVLKTVLGKAFIFFQMEFCLLRPLCGLLHTRAWAFSSGPESRRRGTAWKKTRSEQTN